MLSDHIRKWEYRGLAPNLGPEWERAGFAEETMVLKGGTGMSQVKRQGGVFQAGGEHEHDVKEVLGIVQYRWDMV